MSIPFLDSSSTRLFFFQCYYTILFWEVTLCFFSDLKFLYELKKKKSLQDFSLMRASFSELL